MSTAPARNDRFENYVPVAERIEKFYSLHPQGRILTAIVEHNAETGFVLMRAEVYRAAEDTMPSATGHAFEIKGDGFVNKTSHIENCETGAVGRALANLGLEVKRGIASKEEMQKVERMAERTHLATVQDENDKVESIRDPLAKSMDDLVTPKQLGMIRAISRGANIDADEECQKVLRCRTEELSKKAASSFINHLKGIEIKG